MAIPKTVSKRRTKILGPSRLVPKSEVDRMVKMGQMRPVKNNGRVMQFVASTERVDEQGDIVRQNWDLDDFRNNPVVLWNHDQGMPIGRSVKEEVLTNGTYSGREVGKHLAIWVEWMDESHGAHVEPLFCSYNDGFLKGGSVGFIPKDLDPVENPEDRQALGLGEMGVVYNEAKLSEWTLCSVPANPDALSTHGFSAPVVKSLWPKRKTGALLGGMTGEVWEGQTVFVRGRNDPGIILSFPDNDNVEVEFADGTVSIIPVRDLDLELSEVRSAKPRVTKMTKEEAKEVFYEYGLDYAVDILESGGDMLQVTGEVHDLYAQLEGNEDAERIVEAARALGVRLSLQPRTKAMTDQQVRAEWDKLDAGSRLEYEVDVSGDVAKPGSELTDEEVALLKAEWEEDFNAQTRSAKPRTKAAQPVSAHRELADALSNSELTYYLGNDRWESTVGSEAQTWQTDGAPPDASFFMDYASLRDDILEAAEEASQQGINNAEQLAEGLLSLVDAAENAATQGLKRGSRNVTKSSSEAVGVAVQLAFEYPGADWEHIYDLMSSYESMGEKPPFAADDVYDLMKQAQKLMAEGMSYGEVEAALGGKSLRSRIVRIKGVLTVSGVEVDEDGPFNDLLERFDAWSVEMDEGVYDIEVDDSQDEALRTALQEAGYTVKSGKPRTKSGYTTYYLVDVKVSGEDDPVISEAISYPAFEAYTLNGNKATFRFDEEMTAEEFAALAGGKVVGEEEAVMSTNRPALSAKPGVTKSIEDWMTELTILYPDDVRLWELIDEVDGEQDTEALINVIDHLRAIGADDAIIAELENYTAVSKDDAGNSPVNTVDVCCSCRRRLHNFRVKNLHRDLANLIIAYQNDEVDALITAINSDKDTEAIQALIDYMVADGADWAQEHIQQLEFYRDRGSKSRNIKGSVSVPDATPAGDAVSVAPTEDVLESQDDIVGLIESATAAITEAVEMSGDGDIAAKLGDAENDLRSALSMLLPQGAVEPTVDALEEETPKTPLKCLSPYAHLFAAIGGNYARAAGTR